QPGRRETRSFVTQGVEGLLGSQLCRGRRGAWSRGTRGGRSSRRERGRGRSRGGRTGGGGRDGSFGHAHLARKQSLSRPEVARVVLDGNSLATDVHQRLVAKMNDVTPVRVAGNQDHQENDQRRAGHDEPLLQSLAPIARDLVSRRRPGRALSL